MLSHVSLIDRSLLPPTDFQLTWDRLKQGISRALSLNHGNSVREGYFLEQAVCRFVRDGQKYDTVSILPFCEYENVITVVAHPPYKFNFTGYPPSKEQTAQFIKGKELRVFFEYTAGGVRVSCIITPDVFSYMFREYPVLRGELRRFFEKPPLRVGDEGNYQSFEFAPTGWHAMDFRAYQRPPTDAGSYEPYIQFDRALRNSDDLAVLLEIVIGLPTDLENPAAYRSPGRDLEEGLEAMIDTDNEQERPVPYEVIGIWHRPTDAFREY